jgi:hypothetical protein
MGYAFTADDSEFHSSPEAFGHMSPHCRFSDLGPFRLRIFPPKWGIEPAPMAMNQTRQRSACQWKANQALPQGLLDLQICKFTWCLNPQLANPQICKEKGSDSYPDTHYLRKYILDYEMSFNSISKRYQKIMHSRICGSFKSAKNNWVRKLQIYKSQEICVQQIATFAEDPQIYENIF